MSVFNKLLSPNKLLLSIFGVCSFIVIALYNIKISFSWFLPVSFYNTASFVGLLLILIVCYVIDRKVKSSLKVYALIFIIQFVMISALSIPLRDWLVSSSFSKAERIIMAMNRYKTKTGKYANSIAELNSNLELDLPLRSNIGSKFRIKNHCTETFYLQFYSFEGYTMFYSFKTKKWSSFD